MLRLEGVHTYYGRGHILQGVDLDVPAGEIAAVLGRNGVGKTTLLATIMGHTSFHAGSIEYRGSEIRHLPVFERSRLGVGYVPQGRDIFPSLSLEENLLVAARPGRWTLERVYELLPRLAQRRRQMGNQLSGGEQQMLAIGRALMGNPSLVLLDEPLEGLAPLIVDALLKTLDRLIREDALTVMLVEQSAKLALEVTAQVVVLNRGRIMHHGPSAELLADPQRLTSLVVAS